MADHADHLLPRLHFLPAQLAREVPQEEELVPPAVQREAAARQVVDLVLRIVAVAGRRAEESIAAASDRLVQRSERAPQQVLERHAFEPASLVQQLTRGDV